MARRGAICVKHNTRYVWKSRLGLWMGPGQGDTKVCIDCIRIAKAIVNGWTSRAREARNERLRNRHRT